MSDYVGPERRDGVSHPVPQPIEVRKLSNGARTSVISVIVLLLVNVIGLIIYIVKDHERQTLMEQQFNQHVANFQEFSYAVTEMKLDVREIRTRMEYLSADIQEHRATSEEK